MYSDVHISNGTNSVFAGGWFLFGPALSMGSGEKQAAEQASCSLYQADGAKDWVAGDRGREREVAEKSGGDGGAERSWDRIFNIYLDSYSTGTF